VTVHFDNHFVPQERISGTMPLAAWTQREPATLRFNGSLALGVAARAARLAESPELTAQVDAARAALDGADPQTMPQARAGASELALRAAAALVVAQGSRAVLDDQHGQRLMREATFLLVFGSRPGIRDSLRQTLLAGWPAA
jgi:hypothetical protein